MKSRIEQPTIVIDGRNAQRNYEGERCPDCLLRIVEEFEEFRIIVVLPHWTNSELAKQVRELARLQFVDVTNDPEWDDKMVLALCMFEDGYYVSNDARMFKHLNGSLVDRDWCASRRIGFQFDPEGNLSFHYPNSWHVNIASLESGICSQLIEGEVRQ